MESRGIKRLFSPAAGEQEVGEKKVGERNPVNGAKIRDTAVLWTVLLTQVMAV